MKVHPKDVVVHYECPKCGDKKAVYLGVVWTEPVKCIKCEENMFVESFDVSERALSEKGEDVARLLMSYVNAFHLSDEKEFINGCVYEHRTLQQNLFRMIYKMIQEWAKMSIDGRFDLRNEGTVNACRKIVTILDREIALPFI